MGDKRKPRVCGKAHYLAGTLDLMRGGKGRSSTTTLKPRYNLRKKITW